MVSRRLMSDLHTIRHGNANLSQSGPGIQSCFCQISKRTRYKICQRYAFKTGIMAAAAAQSKHALAEHPQAVAD